MNNNLNYIPLYNKPNCRVRIKQLKYNNLEVIVPENMFDTLHELLIENGYDFAKSLLICIENQYNEFIIINLADEKTAALMLYKLNKI